MPFETPCHYSFPRLGIPLLMTEFKLWLLGEPRLTKLQVTLSFFSEHHTARRLYLSVLYVTSLLSLWLMSPLFQTSTSLQQSTDYSGNHLCKHYYANINTSTQPTWRCTWLRDENELPTCVETSIFSASIIPLCFQVFSNKSFLF